MSIKIYNVVNTALFTTEVKLAYPMPTHCLIGERRFYTILAILAHMQT